MQSSPSGFKRYGFDAEAAQIAHDISKAASYFQLNQLPELYTAFRRDETTFPVQYIGANVPQAWAAGSAFMLTQAMLGFMPDAPHNKLYVDPWLPEWLPDLTIQDVRIGRHKLAIRFWRKAERRTFRLSAATAVLLSGASFNQGSPTNGDIRTNSARHKRCAIVDLRLNFDRFGIRFRNGTARSKTMQ